MKLTRRITIALITIVSVFLIFLLFYFLSYGLILQKFVQLESEIASTDVSRVEESFLDAINNINTKSADWANWDDTYQYIQNKNPDYVKSNLEYLSTINIGINFMLFYDLQGKLVYQTFVDLEKNASIPPLPDVNQYFTDHPQLITPGAPGTNLSGLIDFPSQTAIVSLRPIATSETKGPVQGVIIFGRFLDQRVLDGISQRTRIKFYLLPVKTHISNTISVQIIDHQTIHGYKTISNLNQQPIFTIQTIFPRNIYNQGLNLLRQIGYWVIAGVSILSLVVLSLINVNLLKPLSLISKSIKNLESSGNYSIRVPIPNQPDFSALAKVINHMLATIEAANSQNILANQKLLEARQKLEQELATIQKQNTDLQNSQQAFVNLLEDQKALENQLTRERDRAKSIINSMGEGLLLIDTNRHISLINPAAEKLLETTQAEAINSLWSDLVISSENDEIIPTENRAFSIVISSGKPVITTIDDNHYYTTRSGKKFPVASITTPLFDQNNQVSGAIKVFRDITREKSEISTIEAQVKTRTEELQEKNIALQKAQYEISRNWNQLQQEKARLTTSLNNLPIGFILIDNNSDIILINQTAKNILGVRIEKIPLLSQVEDIIAHAFNLSAAINTCINEKHTLDTQEIIFGKKIIKIFIAPIYMDTATEQSYVGTAVLVSDVTDEKNLSRSRDEFFSIASHELRTPLTAIRGNSSMILDNYQSQIQDPDFKEMISDIHKSSKSLIDLVNEFLNLSRLELGRIEFKKEQFDLVQLLNEVVNELSSQATSKNLSLSIDPTSIPELQINSDRDRVKEVVVNLIGNSIKYTETGSILIKVNSTTDKIVVEVADTGRGIPESQQHLLFKKFQQAEENIYTRDTSKSTGLGLYISKLITEGLGGQIGLSWSEPGKGSCFYFTLPFS